MNLRKTKKQNFLGTRGLNPHTFANRIDNAVKKAKKVLSIKDGEILSHSEWKKRIEKNPFLTAWEKLHAGTQLTKEEPTGRKKRKRKEKTVKSSIDTELGEAIIVDEYENYCYVADAVIHIDEDGETYHVYESSQGLHAVRDSLENISHDIANGKIQICQASLREKINFPENEDLYWSDIEQYCNENNITPKQLRQIIRETVS